MSFTDQLENVLGGKKVPGLEDKGPSYQVAVMSKGVKEGLGALMTSRVRVGNYSVGTSEVRIPISKNVESYLLQCRTAVDVRIGFSQDSTVDGPFFTLKSNAMMTASGLYLQKDDELYLYAASSVVVEVLWNLRGAGVEIQSE